MAPVYVPLLISFIAEINGKVITPEDRPILPLLPKDIQTALPEEFDSRLNWPNCSTIKEIRTEGCCEGSWAFAAVEAMSDRICIQSNGQKNVHLSAQDLLSCCLYCGSGCNGGYMNEAWKYWKENGIVTGGNYATEEGCRPYTIGKCEGKKPERTPKCEQRCQSNYSGDYKSDLHRGSEFYEIDSGEEAIKTEIHTYGPVEAVMKVYEDFISYKSDVYRHKEGKLVGREAVKIIGWGVEQTTKTPYWLAAFSRGTEWGDGGFFKILRGVNECEIESDIVAGNP